MTKGSENIRKVFLRWVLFILFFGQVLVNPAVAQTTKNFLDQNYIEVTGTAEMELVPDQIYVTIVVKETDKPKRTVEEAEKLLVERLKALGIEVKSNLTVLDFLSSAKSGFLSKDIVTSKKYQLLLSDAQTVARVFNDLEANLFTNISISKLSHSRLEQFRQEVKANAIKAAKEKAAMLMRAIGQDIGKALYVEELPEIQTQYRASNTMYAARGYDEVDKFEDLNFEKLRLKSSILVRFEIK
jgi:hypothetical protein